jgi:hypothetical protein
VPFFRTVPPAITLFNGWVAQMIFDKHVATRGGLPFGQVEGPGHEEDEILPSGEIVRSHKSEVLGTLKQFPSKRLAQRELDTRTAVVNNPTYRARPTATFRDLAERWKVKVMPNHEESTQRSEKSDIKALVAVLGDGMVKDISTERVQDVIAGWKGTCSAKTIRNRIATFRLIWDKAKIWNYAVHTPYEGLDLPNYVRTEQPCFKPEDVTHIIAASESRYDVVWALTAECGIRRRVERG